MCVGVRGHDDGPDDPDADPGHRPDADARRRRGSSTSGKGERRASPRTRSVDSVEQTSTSTIHAGETVEWVLGQRDALDDLGTCPLGCIPDGLWDSGIGNDITFSTRFRRRGRIPYFCLVHGAMMQGTVVVE